MFPIVSETLFLQFHVTKLSANLHSIFFPVIGMTLFWSISFLCNKGIVLSGKYLGFFLFGLFGVSTTLSLLAEIFIADDLLASLISLICYPFGIIIGYIFIDLIYNNSLKRLDSNS